MMRLFTVTLMMCSFGHAISDPPKSEPAPVPEMKFNPNAKPTPLTIPEDTSITVEEYDPKTTAFLISLTETPDIGPNYVSPAMLKAAIGFAGTEVEFMNQRAQMIGSIYQITDSLPLIPEAEMRRRQKKNAPGRAR